MALENKKIHVVFASCFYAGYVSVCNLFLSVCLLQNCLTFAK